MPKDFADGHEIAPHRHRRAQLIYATAGTMRVSTADAVWVVPPQRALWMPPGVRHSIVMSGDVTMRTLYLRQDAAAGMPDVCRVLHISPLLRELIVRATEMPVHYDERGAAGHVVALILDELHHEPRCRSTSRCRATGACKGSARPCSRRRRPADARRLGGWANASPRTLARLFVTETGLTFGAWRQQARVLEAMGRLSGGEAVTDVALDLGYDSVSAFSAMFRRASGVSPSAYRPSR